MPRGPPTDAVARGQMALLSQDMEELDVLEVVNAMKYFDRGLEVEPHDEKLQRCKLNNQCEKKLFLLAH